MIQDIKTIPIPFNEISDIFLNIDNQYSWGTDKLNKSETYGFFNTLEILFIKFCLKTGWIVPSNGIIKWDWFIILIYL